MLAEGVKVGLFRYALMRLIELSFRTTDKLNKPWRQMGYQLVDELEAPEGLDPALVVPLVGCGPGYRIRVRIVPISFLRRNSDGK